MPSSSKILITGATGKTGAYVISILLQRGDHVRAFVHRDDSRAQELRQSGAEVIVGDFLDLAAVTAALQGMDTAYFCYPIEPTLTEASAYFAQGARDAGLRGIVNMSQISARREAKSNAARQHWISERVFDWSGTPVTHLRPTFFAEWLVLFAGDIAHGVLSLPFGEGRHAPISAEDQAHVIAAVLEDPATHAGQTYPLFGPVEMNHHEIAQEIASVIGRPVHYAPTKIKDFVERMTKEFQLPAHLVQHISQVAVDYQEGRFAGVNDIVARIGQTQPTTVRAFVEKHRHVFQN